MKKTEKKQLNIPNMPYNLEAEQALLGCILIDTKIQIDAMAYLHEDDFYLESHKNIYNAMDKLVKEQKAVDFVTLLDELEKLGTLEQAGGMEYIRDLTNVMPSSANYQKYLDIVTRDSLSRKLIIGANEIIEDCKKTTDKNASLAFAEKTIYDVSNEADTSEVVHIAKVIPTVIGQIDEMTKGGKVAYGIKTEYKGLDALIKGLHKSDLMILAARPGMGKTSFALNLVENIAQKGYSCACFSLEMSKEQLVQRMLCSVAEVSMENTKTGKISKSEWLRLYKAREILSNCKIYIDDSSMVTPQEILSKCRRIKRRYGLDFVMVDYLQLMTAGSKKYTDNRQQEITEISRNMKILAKEVDVPVLCLSQLSRAVEARKGRPQLSDLRESGAIEQDADIVMFIHRPDLQATEKEIAEGTVKKNVAELLIEKHRNGAQGMAKLYFQGEFTKFKDYVEGENEQNNSNEGDNSVSDAPFDFGDVPLPEEPVEDNDNKTIEDEVF